MSSPRFATARLSTGPTLHYAEYGDADGTPVVFLHGWPDSWFSFSRVVPLLPERIHAHVPDQRGFGDSDKPSAGYAIRDFADDVVALLDALGIERAALVGHSFGTFVARCAALSHPARVERMALIGTGVSGSTPATREVQASMLDLPDAVPVEFARRFQGGTAYAPLPQDFLDRIVDESLKVPGRLWREALEGVLAYDDTADLGRIAVPTLLLWGDRDPLFSREDQDRLVATIPGATLKVYPETGHCPNWERPELVASDLRAFLLAG